MPLAAAAPASAWTDLVRDTLSRYDDPLLRLVAGRLIKPRINQPSDELAAAAAEVIGNPPVIDRRVRDLPDGPRGLLALVSASRQPRWKVGHLLDLAAAASAADGFAPVQLLLESGLAYPGTPGPVADFADWFGRVGMAGTVFIPPPVAGRARATAHGIPRLPAEDGNFTAAPADGLEWPIRLAAAWQLVRAGAVRLTQSNTLFKRDLTRLQADAVLTAALTETAVTLPDAGVLAFEWAAAADLFLAAGPERSAGPFPPAWARGLWPTLADLFAGFFAVETWDPLVGYSPPEATHAAGPTAALLALAVLPVDGWTTPAAVASWLWDNHPSWAGGLSKDAQKQQGAPWAAAFLRGIAATLRIVDSTADGSAFRLSAFGKSLFGTGPDPDAAPPFPQTLLVQPNAEVLAYRQGLTPDLIAGLSKFARWKQIGPACTLELSAEETYRGLENGLNLGDMVRTLDRHGMRPVPAAVADLLRRWADKRDRISVFGSATLVEFSSPADLDLALSRGVVTIKLTDRVGLTSDGREPDFVHLRLIGNRDYEAKPERCVTVGPDGLTLTIEAAQADLLLEAEIGRLADPGPPESSVRKFALTPDSLRRAGGLGMTTDALDSWFIARTGSPLPPAARLLAEGPASPAAGISRVTVVELPTADMTDGVLQWPASKVFVDRRIGPTAVVVPEENVAALRDVLAGIGIRLEDV